MSNRASPGWDLVERRDPPDHRSVVRELPRLFALPLLICLIGVVSFVAAGEVVAARVSTLVDTSKIHLALPTEPSPTDTVWLCRPGLIDNPCEGDLSATLVGANGKTTVEPSQSVADPPVDCFYVYPTVSLQKGTNATLEIDPEERAIAKAEAARFSQVCDVYAPMYPQLTKAAIKDTSKISVQGELNAYEGVWKAFLDYMAHYNRGRGVVFIGHSQGAFLLSMLLQSEMDSNPANRDLMVSALLPGGNVSVRAGELTGGDFANIPACTSATETSCVVAYSTFSSAPGEDALFGRVDSPINPFHQDASRHLQVLCVNPTSIGGGSGPALPYLPTSNLASLVGKTWPIGSAKTPFISYPGEYQATCKSNGVADWLQIDRTSTKDARPNVSTLSSPTWGLHMVDVSMVLGNLVDLVRTQTVSWEAKNPSARQASTR